MAFLELLAAFLEQKCPQRCFHFGSSFAPSSSRVAAVETMQICLVYLVMGAFRRRIPSELLPFSFTLAVQAAAGLQAESSASPAPGASLQAHLLATPSPMASLVASRTPDPPPGP